MVLCFYFFCLSFSFSFLFLAFILLFLGSFYYSLHFYLRNHGNFKVPLKFPNNLLSFLQPNALPGVESEASARLIYSFVLSRLMFNMFLVHPKSTEVPDVKRPFPSTALRVNMGGSQRY